MSQAAPTLIVGIDGGGSGCRVAIRSRDGRLVASAVGGPANVATDMSGALANLRAAIRGAFAQLEPGVTPSVRTVAHAGLAGVLEADTAARIAQGLQASEGFADCTVSDDREIQALGALGGEDGFLAAIGTGTIVARVRDGEVTGVGGWGFVLCDHGSGADMGRAALRRTLMALDGLEPPSRLTEDLAGQYGGATGIVAFAAGARPSDFAKAAPMIVDAATAGDPHAVAIMTDGAAYLDRALTVLGFAAGDGLCLIGGLGGAYRPWLASAARARLLAPVGTALDGAIQRAGVLA